MLDELQNHDVRRSFWADILSSWAKRSVSRIHISVHDTLESNSASYGIQSFLRTSAAAVTVTLPGFGSTSTLTTLRSSMTMTQRPVRTPKPTPVRSTVRPSCSVHLEKLSERKMICCYEYANGGVRRQKTHLARHALDARPAAVHEGVVGVHDGDKVDVAFLQSVGDEEIRLDGGQCGANLELVQVLLVRRDLGVACTLIDVQSAKEARTKEALTVNAPTTETTTTFLPFHESVLYFCAIGSSSVAFNKR